MRGKTSDIVGKRFGLLTVICRSGSDSTGRSKWKCICDCRKIHYATANALMSGDTRSCGCLKSSDLTGKRFGRLTVLGDSGERKSRRILWKCQCDCGNIVLVDRTSLQSQHTQSCGCYMREVVGKQFTRHGESSSRLYTVWCGMVGRCTNQSHTSYKNYGGRGIHVCPEWMSYPAFAAWAYANGYDSNAGYGDCTIDRINNDGNYSPDNCRWVDMKTQANNKRKRSVKAKERNDAH